LRGCSLTRLRQILAKKDATVYLIDAGQNMLQPCEGAPEGWPEDLPYRPLDVAIDLAHTAMRNKCAALPLLASLATASLR
jgi:hypothetical protein